MSGAVRVTLAVVLTAALLGVGLPAAERAGDARTATRLDDVTDRLTAAVTRLAVGNDATRSGAARRTVRLRVPPGGTLRVGRDALAWRVDGGSWHRRRLPQSLTTGGDRLTLAPGRHRLRLSLRLRSGTPTVRVTRASGG